MSGKLSGGFTPNPSQGVLVSWPVTRGPVGLSGHCPQPGFNLQLPLPPGRGVRSALGVLVAMV